MTVNFGVVSAAAPARAAVYFAFLFILSCSTGGSWHGSNVRSRVNAQPSSCATNWIARFAHLQHVNVLRLHERERTACQQAVFQRPHKHTEQTRDNVNIVNPKTHWTSYISVTKQVVIRKRKAYHDSHKKKYTPHTNEWVEVKRLVNLVTHRSGGTSA